VIASIIVIGSALFGLAFVLAWLLRPELRAWLEAPKQQFFERVEQYDRTSLDERKSFR